MSVDTKWSWTILMADGRSFHLHESVNIYELMVRFAEAGNHHVEVQAIIRH